MGYNKFIKYADIIETYTYDRPLPIRPRAKRGVSRRTSMPRVAPDRNDPLRREQYEGKRKDNATRASLVFRRLVSANLGGADRPFLFTCTYKENQTDIAKGYKDFSSFIKALRYKFGKQFRYIAVPEFQKRGAVHFHAMFWGLPDTLAQEERHTRLVGNIWGHGHLDIKATDGHQKLSTYLTKYMAKTFTDYRLLGQKAYTCSRNLIRPEIMSVSNFGLDTLLGDFEVERPEIDKTYDTHWLGKGRHRIYKIK